MVQGDGWAAGRNAGAVKAESLEAGECRQRKGLGTKPWWDLTFRSWEAKRSQEKRLKRYERKKELPTGHGHGRVMGDLREQLGGEVRGKMGVGLRVGRSRENGDHKQATPLKTGLGG